MKAKRKIAASALAVMLLATACSGGGSSSSAASGGSSAAQPQPPGQPKEIGYNLKYDENSVVNNGEKISITVWTDPEIEPFYKDLAQKYQTIHDNVTIQVVTQPWDDYWKKLPLALDSGRGPDLYRAHEGHISNLRKYSHSLPEDVFPRDQLLADFPEANDLAVEGNIYSVPIGSTFSGGVYYNKAMWTEAGLTDADIPTTWDKFIEVGKKLTKTDAKGNITQYGFSIDHAFEGFITDMNLAAGQPLFQADQYTWNYDAPATYENIDLLRSFKNEHKFMIFSDGDCEDQFGHGQTAMMSNLNWVAGYFNETYPDLDYGFFMLPTKDGQTPAAYGIKNYEWTMAVSAADEAKRAVAFDILKYYLCEGKTYSDQAVRLGVIPGNINLRADPRYEDFVNIQIMNEHADRLVYIGMVPTNEARQKALRTAGSDIFINNKDPKAVIAKMQADLMADTQKNNFTYKSTEDQYKYYAEFKK